ncbi:MAG: hypothetical protein HYT21_02010 [Candidatus Nealsonbacteria bacterium]|nr:hypothetical protein [Candidatus Nealsonbacteria bacterium]
MNEESRQIKQKRYCNKMPHLFLLAFFVFIFIAWPVFTFAAPWDFITGPFTAVTDTLNALKNIIINLGIIILLLFTGVPILFAMAAAIAYGAMFLLAALGSAVFFLVDHIIEQTLSVPVVPGRGITIITDGWALSRDIASMFFIVILAFIGLATILGMQTYQVKKLLPALLLMAVLLNFSALPVGFIVDMSNLMSIGFIRAMNIGFANNLVTDALNQTLNDLKTNILAIGNNITSQNAIEFFFGTFLEPVLTAAAKAVFYFAFILALLAISFLFIIRIGILWMLSILAPLAFASYVLPATRKFWSQWWQNLLQWSLMALPMSFFLYLAFKINSIPSELNFSGGGWFGTILAGFIQPLLILLFLFVGFVTSMTFVPGVARGMVMKGGKFMTGTVAVGAGALAAKRLAPLAQKWGAGLKGPQKTEAEIAKMGRVEKFGWGVRQRYGAPLEMAGREAASRIERKETADVEKQKEQFKKMGAGEILNRFKTSVKPSSRAAALWALSERDPAKFAEYIKGNQIKGADVTKAGALLGKRGHLMFGANNYTDALAAAMYPTEWQAAQALIKQGKTRRGNAKLKEIARRFAGAVKDPTQMSASAFKSSAFMGAAVDTWSGDKIGRAATHFGREVADAFQKEIDKKGKDIFKDNGRLALWLTGGAATNAGLHLPPEIKDMTQKEVKNEMIKARISSEKRMDKQTALLQQIFKNNPQLLMRDYHRPGTTEEMKKAIAGAIQNLGRTLPTKEEVNSRIGKTEQTIIKRTQDEVRAIQDRNRHEETYQKAGGLPTGPAFQTWQAGQRDVAERLDKIRGDIKKAEQSQAGSLARLWEKRKGS